jgi:hypothetical protein
MEGVLMRWTITGKVLRQAVAWALLLTIMAGCAATRIKKDPGPHDGGLRYYRPKPYLVVQPANNATDPNLVTITLDYLPDYSEEYSVHIRAGLGLNKTTVKLEHGWNLTDLSVEVDSKFSENVTAFAELIKALPKPGPAGGPPSDPKKAPEITVIAYEVPLGYYEAVISRGPDGVKRMYGWRYVGFAPFAPCPLESSGVQCVNCETADLYGLVTLGNKMYFRKLSDIANTPIPVKVAVGGESEKGPPPPKDGPPLKKP